VFKVYGLLIIGSVAMIAFWLATLLGPIGLVFAATSIVHHAFGIAVGVFYIVVGFGLARYRDWARIATIIVSILGLILAAGGIFSLPQTLVYSLPLFLICTVIIAVQMSANAYALFVLVPARNAKLYRELCVRLDERDHPARHRRSSKHSPVLE
jgi:hypothetical protein